MPSESDRSKCPATENAGILIVQMLREPLLDKKTETDFHFAIRTLEPDQLFALLEEDDRVVKFPSMFVWPSAWQAILVPLLAVVVALCLTLWKQPLEKMGVTTEAILKFGCVPSEHRTNSSTGFLARSPLCLFCSHTGISGW